MDLHGFTQASLKPGWSLKSHLFFLVGEGFCIPGGGAGCHFKILWYLTHAIQSVDTVSKPCSQNQDVILRYCISSCPSSWIPMKIYESNTSVWGNLLPFKSDPFSSIWDLKQLPLWDFLTSTRGMTSRVEGILKMPSSQTGPWWEVPRIWFFLIMAEHHSYSLLLEFFLGPLFGGES